MAYNTPEGKVKKRGRDICTRLGLYHFPVNQGGYGSRGIPDDVVCVNGVFLHIEYKAAMDWTKRTKTAYKTLPTLQQCLKMWECRMAGGVTWVVDNNNITRMAGILPNILETYDRCDLDGVKLALYNSSPAWRIAPEIYSCYLEGDPSVQAVVENGRRVLK